MFKKDTNKEDLAKVMILGQYGLKKAFSSGKVLLPKNEILAIHLGPIIEHVSKNVKQIPLR